MQSGSWKWGRRSNELDFGIGNAEQCALFSRFQKPTTTEADSFLLSQFDPESKYQKDIIPILQKY